MTRKLRAAVVVLAGLTALSLPLQVSAGIGQTLEHREILVEQLFLGPAGWPPKVAFHQAQLQQVWEEVGFTLSDAATAGPEPSPPSPPEVDFEAEVALFLSIDWTVEAVWASGDAVVVDLRTFEPGGGVAVPSHPVRIVGVSRDGLPEPPFRVIQRHDGQVVHEAVVPVPPAEPSEVPSPLASSSPVAVEPSSGRGPWVWPVAALATLLAVGVGWGVGRRRRANAAVAAAP